ncbi:hypothetical protein QS713_00340 [Gleimia hominis]|uniref:Uncharacterized protein n=1 Tax=Gleimia hominis TaxID=595468 RepID=A0ABU3I809_9ACTO|nr:hypothetical protein [Gleimia hominis]MDT3766524.1 hypothetical protein [Gleimia hominis]
MDKKIYKNFGKIFGVILLVIGLAALGGGLFARSFIAGQMKAQDIQFPDKQAIQAQVDSGAINAESGKVLSQWAGQKMTTGSQAKAYADNFIAQHMQGAAKRAGVPGATFATVTGTIKEKEAALQKDIEAANPGADEQRVKQLMEAESTNPLTKYDSARDLKSLNDLKNNTLFQGNVLRGTLLNVYGWSLLGQIALYAGIALTIVGVVLAVWGFMRPKNLAAKA